MPESVPKIPKRHENKTITKGAKELGKPTKSRRSSSRHDLTLYTHSAEKSPMNQFYPVFPLFLFLFVEKRKEAERKEWQNHTYISPTLKQHWFLSRPFTVGKCAYCLRGLIFVCGEHVYKAFMAEVFHEPFSGAPLHRGCG